MSIALQRVRLLLDRRRGQRAKRLLMVSQHPFPQDATLRRNVDYILEQGWELDVVCTSERPFPPVPARPGLELVRLHLEHRRGSALTYPAEYLWFFLRAVPRVMWFSLRRGYRCAQVDNLPDFLVFIAIVARMRGARVVLFMYELMPELTCSRLQVTTGHPLVRLTAWLEQRAIAWADAVIIVNEPCRRRLVERGADPGKVMVVPNSQPARPAVPATAPSGPSSLVTHATLIERYGVQVAIHALAALRARRPETKLSVLGDGDHRPQLEQLAKDLGLADGIEFTGFLPWEEAMARIRGSTVGIVAVLADGYGEFLLPGKLFDYVAEGIPAVCSRLPTIQEYFPADAVAYFEPGDPAALAAQVERLLRDANLRRVQAEKAREALSTLSWECASRTYLAALEPASCS